MEKPMPSCFAIYGKVKAVFRRSDRLLIDGDARAQCWWTGNFIDGPWTSGAIAKTNGATPALSDETRLVVLNRGAHVESDARTMDGWAAAIREARRGAPYALIVARTTPHRHVNCPAYDRPVASPPHPSPYAVSEGSCRIESLH